MVPPPGVSSSSSSPPIAVTNPRATARPSPTPVPRSRSPRRWNGWKTRSRSARWIPGPRSTTAQVDVVLDRARFDADRQCRRRPLQRVLDEVRDDTFEQRGVTEHRRQRFGHVGLDASARVRRGSPARPARPLRACTARTKGSITPACSRLMSRRLPTSVFSGRLRPRSSRGTRRRRRGAPRDVRLPQARRRRLDGGEGSAEVVRYRLEQRGAQLVRLPERRGRRGVGREPGPLAQRGELRGERVEHPTVVGGEARADEREHGTVAEILDDVGFFGGTWVPGLPAAASTSHCSSSPFLRSCNSATASSAERLIAATRRACASGPRRRCRPRGGRASRPPSACATRFDRAPRRQVDEPTHHRAHDDEHDQREQVLALGDRERVDRLGEVAVREQEADDRRARTRAGCRRSAPTATTNDRIQQQHRLRARGRRAAASSRRVSSGSPMTPSSQPADLPATRQAASAIARRAGVGGSGASVSAGSWEMTCTSIGAASRTERLMTEPRTSSVHRDRRLAPRTSCVQFCARANSASAPATSLGDDLVVLAAEVGEQLPVAGDSLGDRAFRARARAFGTRAGDAVGGRHVQAEQLTVRALGHPRRPPDQRLGARRPGDRDEHALACLPGLGDAVPFAVLLERFVDPVRDPEQGELAQRGEVAGPEVVAERGVDLARACRRCRAPCGDGALRASCRPVRSVRPAARSRPGSSRAARRR